MANNTIPRASYGKQARTNTSALPKAAYSSRAKSRVSGSVAKATGIVAPEARPAIKRAQTQARRKSTKSSAFTMPRSDKRQSSPLVKAGNKSPVLVAEFIAGILIISISMFTRNRAWQDAVSDIMIRLTALTAAFFVLFLLTGSKRSGQFAMWFGLLIDLGIMYAAVQKNDIAALGAMISGQGNPIEPTKLLSSVESPPEFHETPK